MDEEVTHAAQSQHRYSQQHGARRVGWVQKGTRQQVKRHGRERVGTDQETVQIGRYSEGPKVIEQVVKNADITDSDKGHNTQAKGLKRQQSAGFGHFASDLSRSTRILNENCSDIT